MDKSPITHIYCLSNECYGPSIYNIGTTKISPFERAIQLYDTGVLKPFKVEFYVSFVDEKYTEISEKVIHALLIRCKVNPEREFFDYDITIIRDIFKGLENCGGKFTNVVDGKEVSAAFYSREGSVAFGEKEGSVAFGEREGSVAFGEREGSVPFCLGSDEEDGALPKDV